MSQAYSVVICNENFNITLKQEVFDDEYCSSPENEMDKKYEKTKWNASTVENSSLEARGQRRARGEAYMGATNPSRQHRERLSLLSFFRSRSLSRRDEVISTRCRPSNSVPPLQSSERNSRMSRGHACLQVDKGGSTRAQRPPPEISREELYQFKMQNYIFCPVESSLMPASFSMDGEEVRKEDSRRRDEESDREDYYEDDYLPEEDRLVLGSQRQDDDDDEGLDGESLDGEGLDGEEVDADNLHQHLNP